MTLSKHMGIPSGLPITRKTKYMPVETVRENGHTLVSFTPSAEVKLTHADIKLILRVAVYSAHPINCRREPERWEDGVMAYRI